MSTMIFPYLVSSINWTVGAVFDLLIVFFAEFFDE